MEAQLDRLLRALLLAHEGPLSVEAVVGLIGRAVDEEEWPERSSAEAVSAAFESLRTEWDGSNGVELFFTEQGWRLRTAADLAPMTRRLWPDRVARLSRAALEALAIIAYRQPCTRIEVEDARGVDSGGIVRSLLERKLVRIIGRKDEPGRPLLYGTTPLFLETFSLETLRNLPTLRDLESMAAEATVAAQGVPSTSPRAATPATESSASSVE